MVVRCRNPGRAATRLGGPLAAEEGHCLGETGNGDDRNTVERRGLRGVGCRQEESLEAEVSGQGSERQGPSHRPNASVEAELTAGNYGAIGGSAEVSGALAGDTLAGSLFVARRKRDGFYAVLTGAGPRTIRPLKEVVVAEQRTQQEFYGDSVPIGLVLSTGS